MTKLKAIPQPEFQKCFWQWQNRWDSCLTGVFRRRHHSVSYKYTRALPIPRISIMSKSSSDIEPLVVSESRIALKWNKYILHLST
jgi:hypothetical protein